MRCCGGIIIQLLFHWRRKLHIVVLALFCICHECWSPPHGTLMLPMHHTHCQCPEEDIASMESERNEGVRNVLVERPRSNDSTERASSANNGGYKGQILGQH